MKSNVLAAVASVALARPFTGSSEQFARGMQKVCFAAYTPLSAFGRGMAQALDRIFQSIERAEYRQREAFFAQAVDLCDLEHRLQHYEHTGLTHY